MTSDHFKRQAVFKLTVMLMIIKLSSALGECNCREGPVGAIHISCAVEETVTLSSNINCSTNPIGITNITVSASVGLPIKFGIGAFALFPNVRSMNLSAVYPANVPDHILTSLRVLEKLDLSRNNLSEISSSIFTSQLQSLTSLNLSQNLLTTLPDDFLSQFWRLTTIDLSCNLLITLPAQSPVNWPLTVDLLLQNNFIPPCWRFSNTSLLVKGGDWWCDNYTSLVDGKFMQRVSLQLTTSTAAVNAQMVWISPKQKFYKTENDSTWRHFFPSHFEPSVVTVSEGSGRPGVLIDRMRPYFSGVWSCLLISHDGNLREVSVIGQIMLSCRSKIRMTYHWSLIASAICTVAMITAGLLCGFGRIVWMTRCFTREVHIVSSMSLHDLQYSPRFAEQRHKILRSAELRKLNQSSSIDPSISSADSFIPAWLPPHRQRSVDPFAHGGGPVTSDEDADSLDVPSRDLIFTSDEEHGEEDDSLDTDEHRTRSRVEELRDRLRRDVVKRVDHVKSRMRESRHSMEESTSKVMRSLKSGSSVAASKMRSGLYNSMESVKFQVRAVTDFCGGGSAGIGQTVSVSTLDTDLDTQTTIERRIVDVTAV